MHMSLMCTVAIVVYFTVLYYNVLQISPSIYTSFMLQLVGVSRAQYVMARVN